MHDKEFSHVLTATNRYLTLLREFDGVISPDCSMAVGQAKCLQQANTYMNRAVGFYLQQHGVPVIPNIRWSDEESFEYCFLGVPKDTIVAISTHGCLKTKDDYEMISMASLIEDMTVDDSVGVSMDDLEIPMYILTNYSKLYGATGMVHKEILESFMKEKLSMLDKLLD